MIILRQSVYTLSIELIVDNLDRFDDVFNFIFFYPLCKLLQVEHFHLIFLQSPVKVMREQILTILLLKYSIYHMAAEEF